MKGLMNTALMRIRTNDEGLEVAAVAAAAALIFLLPHLVSLF